MPRLIVDASVAAKWYFVEEHSDLAEVLLGDEWEIAARFPRRIAKRAAPSSPGPSARISRTGPRSCGGGSCAKVAATPQGEAESPGISGLFVSLVPAEDE